jgi:hypothetical protein
MVKTPNPIKRIELDTDDPLYQKMSAATGLHGGDLNRFLWHLAAPSAIAHLKNFTIQP